MNPQVSAVQYNLEAVLILFNLYPITKLMKMCVCYLFVLKMWIFKSLLTYMKIEIQNSCVCYLFVLKMWIFKSLLTYMKIEIQNS